ncbi:E3 ubiquitin-protein ligase RMA1H1 [Hibiscus syriacus]|uniref:E3 ubiquitin-protein ligase RMA n=1 Tax=Hibiscus syriacus TaxID=106335 RepID=A0A6A3CNC1_HIBSY|nr:E3 ubiquitin-protein ligase RMA1H1-like [Hibiscus syriacus]KAE8730326.1 E3 ubiquitin-protein ligase RMA1H1 [Hibiscus syriacus]
MATERYFEDANNPLSEGEKDPSEKWENLTNSVMDSDVNPYSGFDCNICLDSVQDPVVTLCGHLYCWPCIYKWLHLQTISTENQDQRQQQCPVCKAEVSHTTLIPLYGRGLTTNASTGNTPRRPLGPTCGVDTIRLPNTTDGLQFPQSLHHHGYSSQPQIYYTQQGGYPDSSMQPGGTTISVPDPVTRMLGEMVYTRVFGNSMTDLYTYPNSYNLAGSTSRRIRRQLMQADKSLSRISFFLCCCIFFCLLMF